MDAQSLDEVRDDTDRLDREIVRLMAEQGGVVAQAARFRASHAEVKAPGRVEEVIPKARALVDAAELVPDAAEATYRAMIAGFIWMEHDAFARQPAGWGPGAMPDREWRAEPPRQPSTTPMKGSSR